MSTLPTAAGWIQAWATLALQTAIVLALAAAVQPFVNSSQWRRRLWIAALLGSTLVLASAITGLDQHFASRLLTRSAAPPRFLVRANVPPQSLWLHAHQPSSDAASHSNDESWTDDVTMPLDATSTIGWPAYAWLAGTLLVGLAACLPRLWLARKRLQYDSNLAPEARHRVKTLAAKLGLHRPVRVRMSHRLAGPIAFGVWRPTMGLPADFWTAHAPAEQDAMLAHELAHLRARDPLWLALADTLTALLWWHPVIWWARRRFRAACESAADEASVIVENGPQLLAGCLVALAARWQRTGVLSLLGMAGYRSNLGQRVDRLLHLTTNKPIPRTGTAPFLLLGLGNLAALALATAVTLAIVPSHATSHPTLLALMSSSLAPNPDSATPTSSRDQAEPAPLSGSDPSARIADGAKHDAAITVSLPEVPGLSARAVRLLCTDAITRRLGQSELFSHVACASAGDRQIRITLTFRDPARATAEAWVAGWPRLKLQLEQLGGLEFREVHSDNQALLARNECPKDYEVLTLNRSHAAPPADEEKLIVAKAPFGGLGSTNIAEAPITADVVNGEPRVSIRFDDSGTKRFAEITSAVVGRQLAVVVDGDMLMAPMVREAIRGGRCEITPSDATFDPRFLARLLAHPLPGPVRVIAVEAPAKARGATSAAEPTNQASGIQPHFESSPAATNRVIRIEVLRDGRLLQAGREQSLESFSDELKRLDHADLASNPVKVFVACKSDVPWEHFAAVVKACDEAGVRVVSMREGVSGSALLNDGKILFEMGRFAEAKAKFLEALVQPSDRQTAEYYLRCIAEAEAVNAAGTRSAARMIYPTLPPKLAGQESSTNSPHYSTLTPLNQDALVTRIYRIHPELFLRALEVTSGLPTATPPTTETLSTTDGLNSSAEPSEGGYGFPGAVRFDRSIPFTTRPPGRTTESLQKLVRNFFTVLGIDLRLPSTSSTNAKAVFYNDRAALLYARLTQQEHDLVETALHAVSQTPPMVELAAQFFEIGEADAQALGLDRLGQDAKMLPTPSGSDGRSLSTGNSTPKATPATNTPTTTIRGDQYDWPGRGLTNAHSIQLTVDDALRAARILTDAETRSLTNALMSRGGVTAMAAPRVTTLSGRQAEIQAVEHQEVVLPLSPPRDLTPPLLVAPTGQIERVPVGPLLNLTPIVTDDGRQIRMLACPSLTTFLGYESAAPPTKPSEADSLAGPPGSEPPSTSAPTPLFRVWRTSVHTWFPYDHSLMLLGPSSTNYAKTKDKIPVLGDLPLLGRLFRSESTQVTRKQILILISPAIVDPAGNRITPSTPPSTTPTATPLTPSARP